MMPPSQRFLALDVFRGMTICFMIIVNTPGNYATTFSPLLHADWHGFTPTDLVFPSFLFAVGNALSFVMVKWNSLTRSQVLWKIFRRSLLIFLLGYLMYWFPFFQPDASGEWNFKPIQDTRIMGVLQRIALCYLIAALLLYFLRMRTAVIISLIILIAYWPIMYFFGNDPDPLSLAGNAALKLDLWVLGDRHLYHGEGIAFDPEGILSTFPAVANVIGGAAVGKVLQQNGKTYETLTRLLLAGFALFTIAYFWHLLFPINKKLWTSSFVLLTVGLNCIIIAAIIYIVDFLRKARWTYFFEVFGKNPLFIYLLSEVFAILLYTFRTSPGKTLFKSVYENSFGIIGGKVGSLLFALAFMLICWLVGLWLDKRKIYVKV
jgi:predicted acyltransferase